MVLNEGRIGFVYGSDGTVNIIRLDKTGALVTQDTHGKFYEAVKRGNVYFINLSAGNSTGYTGASAGTPLLFIHNPVGSGKDISILIASIGVITEGTGTAGQAFEYWIGNPTTQPPTGTKTTPTNMYTLAANGSVVNAFVNTAVTTGSALSLLKALASIGVTPGTTATKNNIVSNDYPDGVITLAPGMALAIGARGTGTAAQFDATLIWEEISI